MSSSSSKADATPESASAARRTSTGASRFTFRDAVRSVQAAFGAHSPSASADASGYAPFPSSSRLRLDSEDAGVLNLHDGAVSAAGDNGEDGGGAAVVPYHFPRISDAQLEKLFPLPDSPSGSSATGPSPAEKVALRRRQVARAALDEMELNWKLDPLTLGERSDFNQGCAALVALLARVRVDSKDDPLDYSPSQPSDLAAQQRRLANQSGADAAAAASSSGQKQTGPGSTFVKHWEAHDVLKAIDQQDHETLLLIRDQAMDLLLDLSSSTSPSGRSRPIAGGGGSGSLRTPLGYCISLGPKWDATSIVLCGALSKFVNSLPDGDEDATLSDAKGPDGTKRKRGHKMQLDPRTMQRLRKLKTNLKLAIDHSLFKEQTNLLASYMQVLIMSEGIGWVKDSTESVQRSLESHIRGVSLSEGGVASNPVTVATDCVMQFITVNLRSKRDKVVSVNDYVANAVGDLVLSALWQMVLLRPSEVSPDVRPSLHPDLFTPIPAYVFARDERVAQQFMDRVRELRRALDEARLREDEDEGRRQSRARALSTTSRRSVKAAAAPGGAGPKSDDEEADEGDGDGQDRAEEAGAHQHQSSVIAPTPERTIQLARNRNLRFLRIAEQMAEALGAAFRVSSERRLDVIRDVLKL
ncbi:hypothetical protein OC835_000341 [Tilletia horrida]|nr:hypothetical protein OC835_000341 [Tilletia horrida]KAK0559262.1 hypothetical protein OC844_004538 [Tilletia horrida]